jgi:PhnB protein
MTSVSENQTKYQSVTPYLIVKHAAEFITFTEKVFGASQTYLAMLDQHTIAHAEIIIGESMIMVADATDNHPPGTAGLFIYVGNADDVYNKALNAGATSLTPLADQSYGRSGGVIDPFGITWWITSYNNYYEPK